MCIVKRFLESKPGLTETRRTKLLTNRPAQVISTKASETSATTSTLRSRRFGVPAATPCTPALFKVAMRFEPDTLSAGSNPKTIAAPTDRSTAKISTRAFIVTSLSRGASKGANESKVLSTSRATPTPTKPPMNASKKLSVSMSLISLSREAPSASRKENSR